jgi:hypothetical protein
MNWGAVGAIGEILGAVAVVLTLGYLGIQMHQAHRTARSDARQRILDQFSNALSNFLDSERNRAVLYGGLEDRESVEPADYLMFNHWLNIFATNVFNALRLRAEGILDEEAFKLISNAFVGACLTKGGNVWWQENTAFLPPTLIQHVNDAIRSHKEDIPNVAQLYRL